MSYALTPMQMELVGGAAGGAAYCYTLGVGVGQEMLMCAAVGAAGSYLVGMLRGSNTSIPDPSNMLFAGAYGFAGAYLVRMSGMIL